ncbi:MAG: glycosyltransferase family 4 protein [Deltaproteobacteria bacterium]|jgi:UDP-glucose:(heptosyl)LPS alpha-1,3-glucosyltransferase|nr:glycosyltransferase family 4 protein [Deltaproteobacteria bacterium]
MKRYRIAVMLPAYSSHGGAERFGYLFSAEMAERGHQTDFICSRQEAEAVPWVNVITVGWSKGHGRMAMINFANNAETLREIGEYDCAISLGKTLSQDILRVSRAPLREFLRCSEQPLPYGPSRWFRNMLHSLKYADRLTLEIEDQQFHSGCKIVAVSHFIRDLTLKTYPHLKAEDIDVVYNQPDLARFYAPDPEQIRAGREALGIAPDILAVGQATSKFMLKCTGPMLETIKNFPDNVHFYVAGEGDHKRYDRMAVTLGLGKRVHFLGKVENMPRFYHALDVFALPTYYDACSNATLEALATGLPVLSSVANGASYFLPRENIAADPANPAELTKILEKLLAQAENNKAAASRPEFVWPDAVKAGVSSFADLVETFIEQKKSLVRSI